MFKSMNIIEINSNSPRTYQTGFVCLCDWIGTLKRKSFSWFVSKSIFDKAKKTEHWFKKPVHILNKIQFPIREHFSASNAPISYLAEVVDFDLPERGNTTLISFFSKN